MSEIEVLQKIGSEAVKRLRKTKLASGKPFMINSQDLPNKQSYLEFPDKSIKIVTLSPNERGFTIINVLNIQEAKLIRQKYGLV